MSVASTKNYVAGFINPDNVSLQALNLTSINPLTGEPTFITLSTNEDEELLINDIPVSGGGGSGYALLGGSNTFTQSNLFNGAGPSTVQIGNGEGDFSSSMSLTSKFDTDNNIYGLQITNGGLYLGNIDGTPTDSYFVLLGCSEAGDGTLAVYGNLNIQGNTITFNGSTFTANTSDLDISKSVTINGNLTLTNTVDGSLSSSIMSQTDTIPETIQYQANIQLFGGSPNRTIALNYEAQDDIFIYQNFTGNLEVNSGLTVSPNIEQYTGNTNRVNLYADNTTNSQLNVDGSLSIATPPPVGNDSNLVPTTAWVNAAIAAAIAAIP